MEKAQYLYDCTRVTSPIDGTVLQKSVELGESLRLDPVSGSTSLCVIADLSNLQAEVDVQEKDLPQLSIGQRCRVSPEAAPENVYEAKVERRAPVVNRQRGVVQVKVRILNPDDKLMPDISLQGRDPEFRKSGNGKPDPDSARGSRQRGRTDQRLCAGWRYGSQAGRQDRSDSRQDDRNCLGAEQWRTGVGLAPIAGRWPADPLALAASATNLARATSSTIEPAWIDTDASRPRCGRRAPWTFSWGEETA